MLLRRILIVFALIATAAAAMAQQPTPLPAAFRNVFWQPNAVVQGSVTFFTVEMASPATHVSGRFAGRELSFFKGEKPGVWYALAGVDLETKPGTYELAVAATVPGKGLVHAMKKIDVADANFREGTVTVPDEFLHPATADQRQIAADIVAKGRAYAHSAALPLWSGDFIKPVAAPSTPSFGMTRTLNEERTSQHRGTDFRAPEGSIVSASNAGTVVLAREMFDEGNCIIIDHGQHFFTIYMHLSKIQVAVGDTVAKGDHIALSGATGRVTGPHLHMGVRWNGAYIDPTKLIGLTLPETGAKVPERRPVHSAR
jgi:hypothetical protein